MPTSTSCRGLLAAGAVTAAVLLGASPASAAGIGNAQLVQRTSGASLLCWDNPFAGQASADTFLVREGVSGPAPAPGPLTGGALTDPARRLGNPLRDARLCAVVTGSGATNKTFQVETAGTGGRAVLTSDPVFQKVIVPADDIVQPSITSVAPASGSAAGGDTVTITGAFGHAFDGSSPVSGAVYFSGSPYPAEIVGGSATTVVVKAPSSQTTGASQVLVFGLNGLSNFSPGTGDAPVYDYVPAPPSAILGLRTEYQGSTGAIVCWDKPAGQPASAYGLQSQATGGGAWADLAFEPIGGPDETRACAGFHGAFFSTSVVRVVSEAEASRVSPPLTVRFTAPVATSPLSTPVTAVTPDSGPAAGGTPVSLTGNFGAPTGDFLVLGRTWFSSSAAPVELVSLTRTTAVVVSPKGTAGSAADLITTNANDFTVTPAAFTYENTGIHDPYEYTVSGQAALKTLTRGTVPLSGSAVAQLTLSTGEFRTALTLAPAQASLVALGFLPVKATVAFAALGDAGGTLSETGLTLAEKARVKLSRVSLFGLQLVGDTSTCQTKNPTNLALKSPGAFDPLAGGSLAGTFTISDLTGCGALNGVVSSLTAGGGNTLALKLAPVQ